MPPSNVTVASIKHARADSGEPAWAHASGWAQLSGRPRRVSCVVACRDCARALAGLVPDLSDALTEVGFPWEVVFVDCASKDGSDRLLSGWANFPGFMWVRLAADYGVAAALGTGISTARGDAVITIDASASPSLDLLPDMISVWEEGNELVLMDHSSSEDEDRLVWWSRSFPPTGTGVNSLARQAVNEGALVLMDRLVADSLSSGE